MNHCVLVYLIFNSTVLFIFRILFFIKLWRKFLYKIYGDTLLTDFVYSGCVKKKITKYKTSINKKDGIDE